MRACCSCERVPSNISEAIGLLRRVTSNHNTAEAAGQTEAMTGGLEAMTGGLEVMTGGLEAVTGGLTVSGGLEAMVDMESLLLACCQPEPPTASQQPEASPPGLKENLITTSTQLTV